MKQEHKVESLNNRISELQQQVYARRLDLENAHHGCVESRREKARLQEELVLKEKALRETQIRSMHEGLIDDVTRHPFSLRLRISIRDQREFHNGADCMGREII